MYLEYLRIQVIRSFLNCTFGRWHRIFTLGLFIILGPFLSTTEVRSKEPLIEVSEVVWTNAVKNRNYLEKYEGKAPRGDLYLWMRISCKRRALE